MFGWVSELVMPSASPSKVASQQRVVVPPSPISASVPEESYEEAQVRLRVEAVSEVMLHVADGRLEMAALMLRQAEDDLGRQGGGEQWQKHVGPLQESLAAAKTRLLQAIRSELKAGNQTARFCKLLCMLSQATNDAEEEAYSLLKKNLVDDSFGSAVHNVLARLDKEQDRGQFYIESASRVFSVLMDLVSDHQGLLIQQFGVLRLFEVVSLLQDKCDKLFAVFFERFLDRQVRPMVTEVTNGSKRADDVASLGQLLDVMTKLSLRCEIFGHFIDQVNREALAYAIQIGQDSANLQQQHDAIAKSLMHSLVRRGNLESMSNYVVLELHFLRLSLLRTKRVPSCRAERFEQTQKQQQQQEQKSQQQQHQQQQDGSKHENEEEDEDDCGWIDPDAYFFVLDRSCQRALTGRNVSIGCSVLSAASCHAEMDLMDWLEEAWQGPASRTTVLFGMLLDKMMASSELCNQLHTRLDQASQKMFAESNAGAEKARSCLSGLKSVGRRLDEESRRKAARHAHIVMSSDEDVARELNVLENMKWEDRGAVLSNKISKAAAGISDAVRTLVRQYDKQTDRVASLVKNQLVDWLAHELERIVLAQRKISVDCGVSLESLVQELTQVLRQFSGSAEVRAAFDRVSHMCTVLAVESAADLSDLWESTWPISATEVRSLASKRVDFSAKDVAGLKFKSAV